MTGQDFIVYLLGTVTVISLFMLALLVVWYNQNERRERSRFAQTRADIADMSILFQTMRDIMGQQKALARAFNQEIEKKLSLVRQVLSTTLEKNERLYERQQKLAQELQESRAQLESFQRQLAYLNTEGAEARPQAAAPPQAQSTVEPPPPPLREEASFQPEPPADLPAERPIPPPMDIKSWLTEEPEPFSDPYTHEESAEELAESELSPEDAQSAREAFRSLLNMSAPVSGTASPAPTPVDGNGARSHSLQQRVLEYSQAGMSVADIAAELGVGKGEVRLMLNLSRQKRV